MWPIDEMLYEQIVCVNESTDLDNIEEEWQKN